MPSFANLWSNYPTELSLCDNQCVIRVQKKGSGFFNFNSYHIIS